MIPFLKLNEEEYKRLLKFGVTGVANTLVDVGIYTLLAVALGFNVFFSQCCGYAAGMLNSYLINRKWTFQTSHRFFSLQLIRFIITNLLVLAVSLLLLKIFIDFFGLGKLLAKLAATCITLVLNFVISRLWVFR